MKPKTVSIQLSESRMKRLQRFANENGLSVSFSKTKRLESWICIGEYASKFIVLDELQDVAGVAVHNRPNRAKLILSKEVVCSITYHVVRGVRLSGVDEPRLKYATWFKFSH